MEDSCIEGGRWGVALGLKPGEGREGNEATKGRLCKEIRQIKRYTPLML